MRVTNKIIQNNSVNNINTNKVYQDKLNNQMATEKKIVRPSDDPVVAIRALRLRTNVSQVTQYYEKNIPDADSWLKVTEDALTTVSSVITDMIAQCTKGSSEKLTSTDRQTMLDALVAFRDEVYATGNADYAGRSVFTGYRTESTLMFTDKDKLNDKIDKKYSITEQVNSDVIDSIKYVNSSFLNGLNESNYATGTYTADDGNVNNYTDTVEQLIKEADIHRIRLSYNNTDKTAPVIKLYDPATEKFGDYLTATVISKNAKPSPYQQMAEINASDVENDTQTEAAIYIPETGELLISDAVFEKFVALRDDVTSPTLDESQIQIQYEKTHWTTGDLKPEHYFACIDETDADSANWIAYNQTYLDGIVERQSIEYDVGINQSIRVNTTADEVFTHAIGRDVDDLINALNSVIEMESTINRLTSIKDGLDSSDADYDTKMGAITNQLDAANKAFTYLKEKSQKMFERGITKMQEHLNTVNEATTACGTRERKLSLIQNRLMSQKTNFETLESENENVDITEVAIQFKSAELTYQAALMSVGKILQTSLMNYI